MMPLATGYFHNNRGHSGIRVFNDGSTESYILTGLLNGDTYLLAIDATSNLFLAMSFP